MSDLGTLYGVGVGPGASDLITLRAVKVLQSAEVLALPRSSDFGASVAWEIIEPILTEPRPGQKRLRLTFPMTKDPSKVRPHVDAAVSAIGAHLVEGRSVAFVTEGDPSLFSTFGYVRQEARKRWPGLRVDVVPGVTSITAVAAVGGMPLADGHERIAIVPATYGVSDLVDLLTRFDTVVLMKLGGEMPTILAALEQTGLTDRAFFVSKATMAEQRLETDVQKLRDERGGCFSMLIVKRQDRSGVLLGGAPNEEIP
ncbi:precorrin-2 C(20)-methyltransferase [Pendulispora albinea]|uniref:Precorrin-2 C(20)-methyltransferase n=1 Tax=Pendulispora albinea TaxID=2741071 RepID=A0ABZ2LWZ0_9BACT